MDETYAAKLQIYSVEEKVASTAVRIVRCVGGVARAGQQFERESTTDVSGSQSRMKLESIFRYEQPADFPEPPHSAKVHLSGEGLDNLKRGVIIMARHSST
ncbi:hypothetical protein ACFYPB_33875 [Streptomyces olivaceoviridis]|uniref:hypothetical protein n=1 Tax=Streptomyces olivaceoviridis TaxID=1921 RepID=UPI0036BE9506